MITATHSYDEWLMSCSSRPDFPVSLRSLPLTEENFRAYWSEWTRSKIPTTKKIVGSIMIKDPDTNGRGTVDLGKGQPGFFDRREQRIAAFEKEYLNGLLLDHKGNVSAAAINAQLPRGTLYRLLKKHGLNAANFR